MKTIKIAIKCKKKNAEKFTNKNKYRKYTELKIITENKQQ